MEIKIRKMLYRKMFSYDPRRQDKFEEIKRAYKGPNKKQLWEYQCESCYEWFKKTDLEIDHIIPAGYYTTPEEEGGFRERLLNGCLQRLCKPCHKLKTREDMKQMREGRKNGK
jgi:5-methylcytosine-specific restriction endonuclease McrA